MKSALSIIAAMCAFAAPVFAKVVDGCEIAPADGGGYSNKVDPSCVWRSDVTEDTIDGKAESNGSDE